ncbi:MAG: hypothetical protein NTV88_05385 [Candidatus Micrarchaeota archaeon]|nr:hypothetical protein [Candidatus Micrarchaeota archaeon]
MEEAERAELVAKARRLEGKLLYVKAAEIYLKVEMKNETAAAYEAGGAFEKAADLFTKLGKKDDAKRCKIKLEAARSGKTWADEQAEFQQDKGNPY